MGKGRYKGRRAAAFVFDLDGTLIDSGEDIARSANFVRGHFSLPELPLPTVIGFVGDGVEMLMRRALGHETKSGNPDLPVAPERLQDALSVFRDHYGRHLLDHTRLYPGVLEVLMRFRAFPLLLATNKPREFTDPILAGLGIRDAFARIIAGDETPARKPDPEHLRRVLEGTPVACEEVVVVGDSPNDIAAAHGLGAVAVGCTYGLVEPGRIRVAGPDLLIDSIGELSALFSSRA